MIKKPSKVIPPSDLNKKEDQGIVKTIIIAFIFATIVRSFFYEPFHIPSSSMKPNLLIGDYIFVSKFSYGYSKYSFPLSLNLFSGRIFESTPKRGDAIVFRLPTNIKINYIKRLMGLPGDKIQVKKGQVYINQVPLPQEYVNNFIEINGDILREFKETLPNGKKIGILDQYPDKPQDDTGVYTVPEGHYFMMGDNRDNSQDSRFSSQVGFVPKENLIGKASIIFLSSKKSFWQFWHWGNAIRWDRIFKKIN